MVHQRTKREHRQGPRGTLWSCPQVARRPVKADNNIDGWLSEAAVVPAKTVRMVEHLAVSWGGVSGRCAWL